MSPGRDPMSDISNNPMIDSYDFKQRIGSNLFIMDHFTISKNNNAYNLKRQCAILAWFLPVVLKNTYPYSMYTSKSS